MEFLPVKEQLDQNEDFLIHPDCQESVYMTVEYYKSIGFSPPWIGYYASDNGVLVGNAAFKGRPKHGRVEIAYGTFPQFRNRGIGARICRQLVELGLRADPSILITARTLPEENYSTRILRKNGFTLLGTVWDDDDGNVWEWAFQGG
jgi:RimJ/RimL family protein N-acetyltransferase